MTIYHHYINGREYIIFRAPLAEYFPHRVTRGNPKKWFAFTNDRYKRDIVICGVDTRRECLELLNSLQPVPDRVLS